MTWDATAVAVGIHALGAVEASMNYGAINPTDPISIGIFQWYGTRAAALLVRIQNENASSYANLPQSLRDDLTAHAASDTFWNTRYVTSGEHDGLSSVLAANKPIQDNQAAADFDGYKVTAVNEGMNANTNTKSVLFFANMYNQGPAYAIRVLKAATVGASLDNLLAKCLADPVLGQYAGRYNTAYGIINNYDTGGVDIGTGSAPTAADPGAQSPGDVPVSRVTLRANTIVIKLTNGGTLTCYAIGNGEFLPRTGSASSPTDPGSGTTPDPGAAPVNDYPWPARAIGSASPLYFYYRECVDFAAWRVRTRTARTTFDNHYKGVLWGNAINWDNAAAQAGIRVDSTPAVGSVAQRNTGIYGHVAWVYQVNADGTFCTEEYNSLNDHEYHVYNGAQNVGRFQNFIHFEDTP